MTEQKGWPSPSWETNYSITCKKGGGLEPPSHPPTPTPTPTPKRCTFRNLLPQCSLCLWLNCSKQCNSTKLQGGNTLWPCPWRCKRHRHPKYTAAIVIPLLDIRISLLFPSLSTPANSRHLNGSEVRGGTLCRLVSRLLPEASRDYYIL